MNYLLGGLLLWAAWKNFEYFRDPNKLTRTAVRIQSIQLMLLALFFAYAFIFHGATA